MSGEIEAGGGAVTAGLIGATIEGGGRRKPGHGQACPNCETAVHGNYCPTCGQPAHIHRSVLHMLEEALHGLVHFDTKFWRTLPRLLFRPGTLTREYIHGKRARYVSPMAIFLFTVLLMFFAFSFLGGAETSGSAFVVDANAEVATQTAAPNVVPQTWQEQWIAAVERAKIELPFGGEEFEKKLRAKLLNPDLILYKLQQTAYKLSFLLIPISVPFIALLFLWKRGVTWFDHTVFVLYSLSFMSLLSVAGSGLDALPGGGMGLAGPLLVIAAPLHMAFQVKGAYALGWFSTLWRTAALLLFAGLALGLFAAAIVVLGLMG